MASLPLLPNSPISPCKSTRTASSPHFKTTHFTKLQETTQNPNNYTTYLHQISSLCKQGLLPQAFHILTQMETENLQIGPDIYGELLQGCVYGRAFAPGQQIHAQLLKNGFIFFKNEYVETKLVIFYAKCGLSAVAEDMFVRLRRQNVYSWAAMIGLHSRNGSNEKALICFCEMLENGFFPDNFVIPNVLKACSALNFIGFARGVHGYVFKMGFGSCVFVASSLVDMYGKSGILEVAKRLFDEIPERNDVAWNSMIVGYVQNGMNEEAIKVLFDMRVEGIEPTRVTISSFLSASANLEALDEGRQGHAIAVVCGLNLDNILGSSLINFYSKLRLMEDAELVFYRMVERDVVTWNLMLSGYVQDGQTEEAIYMCQRMTAEKLRFDSVTLSSILVASAKSGNLELGREGHGYSIRHNLESDLVISNNLIDMYAKCKKIDEATRVFKIAKQKDQVMWNTLIATYAQVGLSGKALKSFYQMQLEGVPPDVISWNSVLLGFLRKGQVDEAKDIFSQMQATGMQPNLITWTTLISGLAQNGYAYEAVRLFQEMQEVGFRPNAVNIVGVLGACTKLALLSHGKAFHGHVTRLELFGSVSVVTSLVHMYAACGNICLAKEVFDSVLSKEVVLYNTMISGYALHGQAKEALTLFTQMQEEGFEPDKFTITGILFACNHAGMVDEGLRIFTNMLRIFNVRPSMEHYGCVVSLLSRCGNFDESFKFISEMPSEPDAHILASLLSACKEHNEIELGEYLSRKLFELDPKNLGNYVTLSNAYAAAGKWDDVRKVREMMKDEGRKNPGCSWIQIGEKVHVFVAGDRSHSRTEVIHETLSWLEREMKFMGYAYVLMNTDQNNFRQEILCS